MAASTNVPFTLYTQGTPNGHKASIILEEVGAEYKTVEIRFSENEQKSDWCVSSQQTSIARHVVCRQHVASTWTLHNTWLMQVPQDQPKWKNTCSRYNQAAIVLTATYMVSLARGWYLDMQHLGALSSKCMLEEYLVQWTILWMTKVSLSLGPSCCTLQRSTQNLACYQRYVDSSLSQI